MSETSCDTQVRRIPGKRRGFWQAYCQPCVWAGHVGSRRDAEEERRNHPAAAATARGER